MEARDLELAHVFWAVSFVPPDRVATSTHVHRLRFLRRRLHPHPGAVTRAGNPQIV